MTTVARCLLTGDVDEAQCAIAPRTAERASLRESFLRSSDAVYRFILVRVGGDREAADELLQECCRCAAAHRHPPRDAAAWPGWFCGIARNLVRRRWRRLRRQNRVACSDKAAATAAMGARIARETLPEQALLAAESVQALMAALGELNAKDRELVFAFYFDGQSYAEIAALLHTTSKGVEARLHRARRRLREILDAEDAP